MATTSSSRYFTAGTYTSVDTAGRSNKGFELRTRNKVVAKFIYVPNQAERIDTIALKFYQDPERFWVIADVSDELDPFDVVVEGRAMLIAPDIR